MRRVIVPALLAVVMVAGSSANASAFGLFDKLCHKGCDTGCAAEPACGCEVIEPACGCEVAEPTCGCGIVEPACGCEPYGCDTGCGHKHGLLAKLFGKHRGCGCDTGCAVEPACGCEVAAPACGCEVAAPVCDSGCCGKKKFGLLHKLFNCCKSDCCDSGCATYAEPACGCEVIEPACGCEVAAPSCGCGH
ncbi:keratin-like protein [Roseiconus nitratireducens]|uniref:Keratin-like protein n=1 Tax=Roseiconus nitratireducens TaxID=2605748 RepID=A0A5M6D2I4_9BACT|nr:keratin-like protein [Roseiconus nitratireducens]KAA5539869.1 keratin-like protein [Roseiconus nitratireducens]